MSRRVRILIFAGLVALAVALFITSDPPARDSNRALRGGTATAPEPRSEVRRYLSLVAFLAAFMVTHSARGARRVDEVRRQSGLGLSDGFATEA